MFHMFHNLDAYSIIQGEIGKIIWGKDLQKAKVEFKFTHSTSLY